MYREIFFDYIDDDIRRPKKTKRKTSISIRSDDKKRVLIVNEQTSPWEIIEANAIHYLVEKPLDEQTNGSTQHKRQDTRRKAFHATTRQRHNNRRYHTDAVDSSSKYCRSV